MPRSVGARWMVLLLTDLLLALLAAAVIGAFGAGALEGTFVRAVAGYQTIVFFVALLGAFVLLRWRREVLEGGQPQTLEGLLSGGTDAGPRALRAAKPSPFDLQVEMLKRLAELKDAGILSEQEFTDQKAKILGQLK